jgi:UPF0755 protein
VARHEPAQRALVSWRGFLFVIVLLILLALAGTAALYVQHLLSPLEPGASVREFEVEPGLGAARVAQALEDEGFIRDSRAFVLYLRYQGADRSIGEGLYDLSAAMSLPEIAEALALGGRPRVRQVVVPEGFRAVDIAARLAANGFGEAEGILALIQDPGELRPDYLPEGAGLEGYLFPASYTLPVRSSLEEVLRTMLRRFEQELSDEVYAALEALNLEVHDWVTLASMVQAEAGSDEEMPYIAGVFLNRLDEGMLLQSDPTVAYGLGIRLNQLDRSLGHFTQTSDHPWNTYTRGGLPATPIGNPGREALRSVLEAERFNEAGEANFFFLHSRDGSIFRLNTSFEDHSRDVQRYLR